MKAFAILVVLTGLTVGLWAQTPPNLPVTRVVLYTSGVEYVERAGTLTAPAALSLVLDKGQLNDLLKSLTISGAPGTQVSFPVQEPLAHALAGYTPDLSGEGGLASLLPQLRGLEVRVYAPNPVSGRLVGVDTQTIESALGRRQEELVTLDTPDGLKRFPLTAIASFQIEDASVRHQLTQALERLAAGKDARRQLVKILFPGKGVLNVKLGYEDEAPVWRTSYRLLLGNRPILQGWAVVENTSEADWHQIQLSLVAGSPLSVADDLATPRWVRPVPAPTTSMAPMARMKALELQPLEQQTVTMGPLFRFDLSQPVSLARHDSAQFELFQTPITLTRVSVCPPQGGVLSGVRLVNGKLPLAEGPITVLDDSVYAGDAHTGFLAPGQTSLWTYAYDSLLQRDQSEVSEVTVTSITASAGVLRTQKEELYKTEYRLTNLSNEKKTVVVEQPVVPGRELVSPAQNEVARGLYQITVVAEPLRTTVVTVLEKRPLVVTEALTSFTPASLRLLIQSNGPLSPELRKALDQAAGYQNQVTHWTEIVTQLSQDKAQLTSDEERQRQNLTAAGRDSPFGQETLRQLAASESQLAELAQRLN
ncbi:MAG: hypothetical protein HKM05_04870, partial [Spirochaetales bacterium]|nr:hypothetical protein [Spirochaetales bacterium]